MTESAWSASLERAHWRARLAACLDSGGSTASQCPTLSPLSRAVSLGEGWLDGSRWTGMVVVWAERSGGSKREGERGCLPAPRQTWSKCLITCSQSSTLDATRLASVGWLHVDLPPQHQSIPRPPDGDVRIMGVAVDEADDFSPHGLLDVGRQTVIFMFGSLELGEREGENRLQAHFPFALPSLHHRSLVRPRCGTPASTPQSCPGRERLPKSHTTVRWPVRLALSVTLSTFRPTLSAPLSLALPSLTSILSFTLRTRRPAGPTDNHR